MQELRLSTNHFEMNAITGLSFCRFDNLTIG